MSRVYAAGRSTGNYARKRRVEFSKDIKASKLYNFINHQTKTENIIIVDQIDETHVHYRFFDTGTQSPITKPMTLPLWGYDNTYAHFWEFWTV